ARRRLRRHCVADGQLHLQTLEADHDVGRLAVRRCPEAVARREALRRGAVALGEPLVHSLDQLLSHLRVLDRRLAEDFPAVEALARVNLLLVVRRVERVDLDRLGLLEQRLEVLRRRLVVRQGRRARRQDQRQDSQAQMESTHDGGTPRNVGRALIVARLGRRTTTRYFTAVRSHTRTVLSTRPAASNLPFGLIATERTSCGIFTLPVTLPVVMSHTSTVLPSPPVATVLLSGPIATAQKRSGPVGKAVRFHVVVSQIARLA